MSKWIEVNIPFGPVEDDSIPIPSFDGESVANKYIGPDIKQLEIKAENKFVQVNDTAYKLETQIAAAHPRYGRKKIAALVHKKMIAMNKPAIKAVFAYRDARDEYESWLRKQPEWIEYQTKYTEVMKQREQDSMYKRGLIKPGVLLDTEKGLLLIGHINNVGGCCDDCRGIEKTDLVKCYRIVWDEAKETKA
jgi:hypothetical protein